MELVGTGQVVEVRRRDEQLPPSEMFLAAVTINMCASGVIRLLCTLEEAAEFRLGQTVKLTVETVSQTTAFSPAVPMVAESTPRRRSRRVPYTEPQLLGDVT